MSNGVEKRKQGEMLPSIPYVRLFAAHRIVIKPTHKIARKSERRMFREHVYLFEIAAIAKVSIS